MKVSVYGAGYVGLVTAACLADVGNRVTCVDISAERVAALRRGEIPIYEPGREDLVGANVRAARLSPTLQSPQIDVPPCASSFRPFCSFSGSVSFVGCMSPPSTSA